jgi:hypothetical protein
VLATFGVSLLAIDVLGLRIMLVVLCAGLIVFLVRLPVVDLKAVALAGHPDRSGTPDG